VRCTGRSPLRGPPRRRARRTTSTLPPGAVRCGIFITCPWMSGWTQSMSQHGSVRRLFPGRTVREGLGTTTRPGGTTRRRRPVRTATSGFCQCRCWVPSPPEGFMSVGHEARCAAAWGARALSTTPRAVAWATVGQGVRTARCVSRRPWSWLRAGRRSRAMTPALHWPAGGGSTTDGGALRAAADSAQWTPVDLAAARERGARYGLRGVRVGEASHPSPARRARSAQEGPCGRRQ